MIGYHIEGQHRKLAPTPAKEDKKEEISKKIGKKIDAKSPKFIESETREEFKRKKKEFQS